jgi:hypothetical protein
MPAKLTPVEWSPKALDVPEKANLNDEFAKPYTGTVAVALGQERAVVKDCTSNLELAKKGFEPKAAVDYGPFQAMGVRCLALKALAEGAGYAKSFLHGTVIDEKLLPQLPAVLALAVSPEMERRRKEMQEKGASWSQFDPKAKPRADSADTLTVTTPGFEQRIQILGRGDFDGDSTEDWLVQDEAFATGGSYRSVRLLILTRSEEGGPIKLVRELTP